MMIDDMINEFRNDFEQNLLISFATKSCYKVRLCVSKTQIHTKINLTIHACYRSTFTKQAREGIQIIIKCKDLASVDLDRDDFLAPLTWTSSIGWNQA